VLHGRVTERARLDQLVADAAASHGGALVVRGEPGAGKTALIGDLADRVAGMTVLWTAGVEAEAPLAYAGLHRLLRPALGQLDRIPPGHARALRRALGEHDDQGATDPADLRFVVFAATLSLLAEASEARPVLCIVDDAHWLDAMSSEALQFVARRLHDDRIAMVLAGRAEGALTSAWRSLPTLEVPGLDSESTEALLAEHAQAGMTDEVREELRLRTGGNPLALTELARALSRDELAGRVPLPVQLPLTEGVQRAFIDRCRRLSEDAQTLLLVAAADDSGRLSVIREAAVRLGVADAVLDVAETSGLLHIRGDELSFRHPLVRSAIYGASTTLARQGAHRSLAVVLAAAGDEDRGTWHAALAAAGPDEAVAADLDRVAERATTRGGHQTASAVERRAAELSRTPQLRARRLFAAATSSWLAGDPTRARSYADDARAGNIDRILGADIDRLRGRIEWHLGFPEAGQRTILRAADRLAGTDDARSLEMVMLATTLASWTTGEPLPAQDHVRRSVAMGPEAPARLRCIAALVLGHQAVLRDNMGAAATSLRQALSIAEGIPADFELLATLGSCALHTGDVEVIVRSYERLLTLARDVGGVTTIMMALSRLPAGHLPAGRWSAAMTASNEALILARGIGQPPLTALPLAWQSLFAALRGDPAAASASLAELENVSLTHRLGIVAVPVRDLLAWAKGLLSAGSSDPESALHHLARIGHPAIGRLAAVDRIDAAVRTERRDLARRWIAELSAFAAAASAPWAEAAAEHGRALLTRDDSAEGRFQNALRLHGRSPRPFAQARTELAYGEWLRRHRRRVDARSHLRAGLQVFDDLHAEPWAERARQELRACGVTAQKRDTTDTSQLTPQERQTALLVRSGLGNREIAARLFLSPRTVEHHLSNAYRKLGIRSRGELTQLSLT